MAMTAMELALWWYQEVLGVDPTPDMLKKTSTELKTLRDKGISSDKIKDTWMKMSGFDKSKAKITDPFMVSDKPGNLLKEERYLHPRLNELPTAISSSIDDDGTVHHTIPTYTPKRIPYFSLEDLLAYYYGRFPGARQNPNRDRGSIEYLLKTYGLDKLLFIIDAARLFFFDEDKRPPKTPLEVCNYEDEGISAYNDKLNY
jgi:hypothetical protein